MSKYDLLGQYLKTQHASEVPMTFAEIERVVGTGLCVQYWDPTKALGFFHEFSGWVIFIVAFGLLLLVHRALQLPYGLRHGGRTS